MEVGLDTANGTRIRLSRKSMSRDAMGSSGMASDMTYTVRQASARKALRRDLKGCSASQSSPVREASATLGLGSSR